MTQKYTHILNILTNVHETIYKTIEGECDILLKKKLFFISVSRCVTEHNKKLVKLHVNWKTSYFTIDSDFLHFVRFVKKLFKQKSWNTHNTVILLCAIHFRNRVLCFFVIWINICLPFSFCSSEWICFRSYKGNARLYLRNSIFTWERFYILFQVFFRWLLPSVRNANVLKTYYNNNSMISTNRVYYRMACVKIELEFQTRSVRIKHLLEMERTSSIVVFILFVFHTIRLDATFEH